MKLDALYLIGSRLCPTHLTLYISLDLDSLLARISSTSHSSTPSIGILGGFGANCPRRGS
jgi:hypothetical protein